MPADKQLDTSTTTPTHRLTRAERTKIGLPPRPSRIEQLANAHPSDETDDATLSEHFSSPSSTDSSLPRSPELNKTSTSVLPPSKAWADMTEEDLALQGPPRLPTPTWADSDNTRTRDKLLIKTRPTSSAGMRQRPLPDSTLGSPVDLPVFNNRPFIRSSSESQADLAAKRQVPEDVEDISSSDDRSPSVATPEPQSASSGPPDHASSQQASPATAVSQPEKSPWDEPAPYEPQWQPPPVLSRNAYLSRPLRGRGGRGRGESESFRSPYTERRLVTATPRHLATAAGWRGGRPPQPPINASDEVQFPPLPTTGSSKPAINTSPAAIVRPSDSATAPRPPPTTSAPLTSQAPSSISAWKQGLPPRPAATTHMRNERGEWVGWGRGRSTSSDWSTSPAATTTIRQHPPPVHATPRRHVRELSSWDDDDDAGPVVQQEQQATTTDTLQQAGDGWDPPITASQPQALDVQAHAANIKHEAEGEHRSRTPDANVATPAPADLPFEISRDALAPPALPPASNAASTATSVGQAADATTSADSIISVSRDPIVSAFQSPSKSRKCFAWQSPFSHAIDTNDGEKMDLMGVKSKARNSPSADGSLDSQAGEGVIIGDRTAQKWIGLETSQKVTRFGIGSIKLRPAVDSGSADDEVDEAMRRRRKRVTVACQTDLRSEVEAAPAPAVMHRDKPAIATVEPTSSQHSLHPPVQGPHRHLPPGYAVDANNHLYHINNQPVWATWGPSTSSFPPPASSTRGPVVGGPPGSMAPQQYVPFSGPVDDQLSAQHLASQPQPVVAQTLNSSAVQLRQLLTTNAENITAAVDSRSQGADDFDPTAIPAPATGGQAYEPHSVLEPPSQPASAQTLATDATTMAVKQVMAAQIGTQTAHQHQAQPMQQPAPAPIWTPQQDGWTWKGSPTHVQPYWSFPQYPLATGESVAPYPAAAPPPGLWAHAAGVLDPGEQATLAAEAHDAADEVGLDPAGPHPPQQHAYQGQPFGIAAPEVGYAFEPGECPTLPPRPPTAHHQLHAAPHHPSQRSPERAGAAGAHRGGTRPHPPTPRPTWTGGIQHQHGQAEAGEHETAPTSPLVGRGGLAKAWSPQRGRGGARGGRGHHQVYHPPHHHQEYSHQQHHQQGLMTTWAPTQPAAYQQAGLPARPPPPTGPAAHAPITSPHAQHQHQYFPPAFPIHLHQQHYQLPSYPAQPHYAHFSAPHHARVGQGRRRSYGGNNEPAKSVIAVAEEGPGGQQKVAVQLREAATTTAADD